MHALSRFSSMNQDAGLNIWIQVFSRVVHCVVGFEYRCVWIHHHPTNTQSHPALPFSHLHLDCRTMRHCVCLPHLEHTSFEETNTLIPPMQFAPPSCQMCEASLSFHTCFRQMNRVPVDFLRKSDVNESLDCSWKYAVDVVVFQLQWFDKLIDIMIEPNTLLAESTDSSCARHGQTHLISLFWMYSMNLFLFRSRTQPPLLLLHRSPLFSSLAWGLVMPRAFARVQASSHHQIFRQISIVDLTRILLVLSGLFPIQVRFLVLSLRSPQLFSSDHPL